MGKRSRQRRRESGESATPKSHLRVIVPFTNLEPEVLNALHYTGFEWDAIDVSGSDTAYFELIKSLWENGSGWMNCEHDIVPHANSFQEFEDCPHAWCAYPYPYAVTNYYAGLGLCKITKQVIKRHPDAMDKVWKMTDPTHPINGHWCRCDGWLRAVLENEGERMHLHTPPVRHLGNTWPSHGCVKPPEGD